MKEKGFYYIKYFVRIFKRLLISFLVLSILSVAILRWIDPIFTPLMLIRKFQYGYEINYQPVSESEISLEMKKAVIAAEDQRFLSHWGFDFQAIEQAIHENKHRKVKRGASTISQQTAKNVFLFPARSWIRKGLEVYFTVLIELFWSKKRILEVYLNVIEMGEGVYGVEAASEKYFKCSSKQLTAYRSARIAAILPAPLKWSVLNPNSTALYRNNIIFYMSRNLPPDSYKDLK